MLATGDADAVVTGVTRNYAAALSHIRRVLDAKAGHQVFGMAMLVSQGRNLFVADTSINEKPSAGGSRGYRRPGGGQGAGHGHRTTRVALVSFSNFGSPR